MLRIKQTLVALLNKLTLVAILGTHIFNKPPKTFTRLGSVWGGWWIEIDFLNSNSKKLLVSAGLGGDISFEKELADRNFEVIGIDPDPVCHKHIDNLFSKEIFTARIVAALSVNTGNIVLFKKDEGSFDSWTDLNSSGDRHISREFQAVGIQDVYRKYNLDSDYKGSYLKMDIEGGELGVLKEIIKYDIKFTQLSVELDFLNLIPATSLISRYRNICKARTILADLDLILYEFRFNEGFNFYWTLRE
jgi:FkbM family methyltransferase